MTDPTRNAIVNSGRMSESSGANLVFLVGCPRSGTTWLQKLLASHPKMRSGAESHFFSLYVGPQMQAWKMQRDEAFRENGHAAGPPAYFSEEEFLTVLKNYLSSLLHPMLARLESDEIFLEKTPSHALFISEIKELLPNSRFIHLLRDPRDVVVSLMAASEAWGRRWAPKNAEIAIAMWMQHVQAARAAARNLSGKEFYEVTYEHLWQAPLEVLTDLARFLGLSWDAPAIELAIQSNRAEVVEISGTPIPVYGDVAARGGSVGRLPKGFVRKAKPGAGTSELSLYDKYRIWRATRSVMSEMGYMWSLRDWV